MKTADMKDIPEYITQGVEGFEDFDAVCHVTTQNNIVLAIDPPGQDYPSMMILDLKGAEQLIANLLACVELARLNKALGK